MKWLINEAFLTPSVEQLLRLQAVSWASKTIERANASVACRLWSAARNSGDLVVFPS